jgi:membrane-associated phospholipid phosphatase
MAVSSIWSEPPVPQTGGRWMAYKWALGLTAAAAQSAVYFMIGYTQMVRSTELLRTRFDDAIPFWPWTAWCYLPFYVGVFVICIIGFRTRLLLHRALVGVFIIMILGAAGHLLVSAEYPRPVLSPPYPDLSTAFLALVQKIDPPGNVFPSLHVAQTTGLALLLYRDGSRLGPLALLMATLLALSTLTTKQHFIADVISGYALAFLARWLVLRGIKPVDGKVVP